MSLKTIVTLKENDRIICITEIHEMRSNGLFVNEDGNEYIIGFMDECIQYDDVDTPDEVKKMFYKYNPTDGFAVDETFVPYVPPEEKIATLESVVSELINFCKEKGVIN